MLGTVRKRWPEAGSETNPEVNQSRASLLNQVARPASRASAALRQASWEATNHGSDENTTGCTACYGLRHRAAIDWQPTLMVANASRLDAQLRPHNYTSPAVCWCAIVKAFHDPSVTPQRSSTSRPLRSGSCKGVGSQEHQIRFSQNLLERMNLDGGVIGEVGFAGKNVKTRHQEFSGDV